MDSIQAAVLALLRSGLTDTPCRIEESADWDKIFQIAEYHGVKSIIYRAIRVSRLEVPGDILTKLKAGFINDIRTNRFQMSELNSLFAAFEKTVSISFL